MRALVLGGSVFVGRRLVGALVEAGHDVGVLNRGRTAVDLPEGVRRLTADRTDLQQMRDALGDTEWDAVYDVSGFVMTAGGTDIPGLLDLFEGRTGHYVYVSSIMAYRQGVGIVPWTEDLPTTDPTPATYGGFKALVEQELRRRWEDRRFPSTSVRPAAIYGPDNNIYDMEAPMFLRLLRGLPILVPHEGLVAGSYGHVDDLCRCMIDLAGRPEALGEVVNVTTDGVTVEHYVRVLAEVVGREPRIVMVPESEVATAGRAWGHLFGKAHHGVLSTEKMRALLGFQPRYGLREGHEHTYQWFLEQGHDRVSEPLVDPTWRATWDFEAEARLAERLEAA